jgi:hypothetical protein
VVVRPLEVKPQVEPQEVKLPQEDQQLEEPQVVKSEQILYD